MLFTDANVLAKETEALRHRGLFEGEETEEGEAFAPLAEQHYLAAIAALELAERQFKIAALHQAAALGAGRGPR